MGWFKKEENVHFVRDENGKVINVERTGDVESAGDKFINEVKAQKRQERMERREVGRERRREYKEAFAEARHKATLERMKREGGKVGSMNMSQRFNNVANRIQAQPYSRPYSTHNNYNPFGSMYDKGMNYKRGSNPVIKNMNKKKKHKRQSISNPFTFDMFDNYGFMKRR
jgi:hypothetical protein